MNRKISLLVIATLGLSMVSGCSEKAEETHVYDKLTTDAGTFESYLEDTTTTTTSETTSAEEFEKGIPVKYYDVLDSIRDYVVKFDPDTVGSYIGKSESSGIAEMCQFEGTLDQIGFAFPDIDSDGVGELVVLALEENNPPRVLEMYTYQDGEAQHLFSGWARNRYYISKDLKIYNEGSSGAFSSVEVQYGMEDRNICFVDAYYTLDAESVNQEGDADGLLLCYTKDEGSIGSEDINSDPVEVKKDFKKFDGLFSYYDIKESDLLDYGSITKLSAYAKD